MSFSLDAKREIHVKYFTSGRSYSRICGSGDEADSEENRRFLAEIFLRSGTVSDPKRSLHLEFICVDEAEAGRVSEILESIGAAGFTTLRKGRPTVYAKSGDSISRVLAFMGAFDAVLELENVRALRETRGAVQRRVNFETANISRTVSAYLRQAEDIRYIEEHLGLDALPEGLMKVAELRLSYPEASLSELAEHAGSLGRSGINHRLRKIGSIAEELRRGKYGQS